MINLNGFEYEEEIGGDVITSFDTGTEDMWYLVNNPDSKLIDNNCIFTRIDNTSFSLQHVGKYKMVPDFFQKERRVYVNSTRQYVITYDHIAGLGIVMDSSDLYFLCYDSDYNYITGCYPNRNVSFSFPEGTSSISFAFYPTFISGTDGTIGLHTFSNILLRKV